MDPGDPGHPIHNSIEDVRPHIMVTTVCPSQQEKGERPQMGCPRPKDESPGKAEATGIWPRQMVTLGRAENRALGTQEPPGTQQSQETLERLHESLK